MKVFFMSSVVTTKLLTTTSVLRPPEDNLTVVWDSPEMGAGRPALTPVMAHLTPFLCPTTKLSHSDSLSLPKMQVNWLPPSLQALNMCNNSHLSAV